VNGKPLAILGDYAWDVLIRTNTELLQGGDTYGEVLLTPGGSAANVAVWAQRCGLPTRFVGKIGRDRFGELAQRELAHEGVDSYLVETDAQRTGSVAVFIDHSGERSMISGRGADHYLLPSELPRAELEATCHLHLTAWSFFTDPPRAAAREAAKIAAGAGATLSLDPGSFQLIGEMGVESFLDVTTDLGIDLLLPNREEGNVLTGLEEPAAICRKLAEQYGANVILKLDAEGSQVYWEGECFHIPPATDRLVDATGAGDSFAGAFLAAWLSGRGVRESAGYATRVSAWTIQRLGARPPLDGTLDLTIGE